MTSEWIAFLVGAGCFALSTRLGIKLRDELTVPTAAALAPVVAVMSLSLDGSMSNVSTLAIPAGLAAIALLAGRVPLLELLSHVVAYLILGAGMHAYAGTGGSLEPTWVPAVIGAVVYSVVEAARQKVTFRGHAHIKADLRMWLLLQGVVICASGLTVLVVDQLGWATFVAMAIVLFLTKREFEGFALSRAGLEQTVRALEKLSNRTGTASLPT